MTRQTLRQGIAGVVIDGACSDVTAVRTLGLPVVSRGILPKRAVWTHQGSVNNSLLLWGITVCPGNLIVSDEDGTVVVPLTRVSNLVVDQLPREVRAFEYRHVPDPHSIEQVVRLLKGKT